MIYKGGTEELLTFSERLHGPILIVLEHDRQGCEHARTKRSISKEVRKGRATGGMHRRTCHQALLAAPSTHHPP